MNNSEVPVSIHCFSGAVNFVEFCNGFDWGDLSPLIKPLQEGFKTYQSACCNKNTWHNILESLYADFLKNNAQNQLLVNNIKGKTKTEKLMFMNAKGGAICTL